MVSVMRRGSLSVIVNHYSHYRWLGVGSTAVKGRNAARRQLPGKGTAAERETCGGLGG